MTHSSALGRIRGLDYTVVFARDMPAMRNFYEKVMRFPLERELGRDWIEYRVGSNILAIAHPHITRNDAPTPKGAASLQLAFRVAPPDVSRCEEELKSAGVAIISPTTDQPWHHRTLFFRDPDGNVLEIYADI
jgi:catechol 2,3-dioxygenase-like lactoylglutathione lyase family enzyme